MFEPVHGSAPDIAGQGKANPLGALRSAAMMLDHLGHPEASEELMAAAFGALADGVSTADLGGTADTVQVHARGAGPGRWTWSWLGLLLRPAGMPRGPSPVWRAGSSGQTVQLRRGLRNGSKYWGGMNSGSPSVAMWTCQSP
ncbi:isocitrate/isopropylmalate family dehydrogenase [Amycolatopsis sp. BJA-103]|uniref:isocitrate/isopropylmalate family dehydrogenase n=1 Tax=Amycolatopsis sp. BJA-103 TaxID=1911175 RepID=UPI001E3CB121|nr:isocitrate/isopropylmalate family dehydrogenase [Amycolatopsis sp. BJA-103]